MKQHAGRATKGKRIYLCIAKIERRASKFTSVFMILHWKMYYILIYCNYENLQSTLQARLMGLFNLYSTGNNKLVEYCVL